jgi:hypothetical protein
MGGCAGELVNLGYVSRKIRPSQKRVGFKFRNVGNNTSSEFKKSCAFLLLLLS